MSGISFKVNFFLLLMGTVDPGGEAILKEHEFEEPAAHALLMKERRFI